MGILPNARHERFAQAIASGMTTDDAYVAAGYAANRGNAARMNANESIRGRVEEILTAGATRAEITVEQVARELAKIGFANMADYMKAGPDGDPYLDFSGLTRDQAAALSEVTVEDFKDGRGDDARDVRRIKFKLHDKRAALVDLGKHLGMFKEKVEVSGPDGGPIQTEATFDVSRLSTEALREVLAAMEATDNSMNDDG